MSDHRKTAHLQLQVGAGCIKLYNKQKTIEIYGENKKHE